MYSLTEAFPKSSRGASARRRVLHVCPYMHPFAGGPPVVVERLAGQAAALGWEASVLTTSFMCPDDGRTLAAELGGRLDIEILPLDRPRIMGHASRAAAAMDAAVREADIVHVHTLWHPLNVAARRACRRHGKPYVLSPHGMLDPVSIGFHAWRKRAYLALVERRNLAGAARVLFTTDTERELAEPLAGRGQCEVVSLGADHPPALSREELAGRFLATHPGGVEGRRILFLARLHPKKGLECLLDAMPAVIAAKAGAHLFVVGAGLRSYEETLRKRSDRLGIASRVTFTGFLANEDKWSAMAAADVFVLPSRQENFAIAVVEAMRAGLPVVVSRAVNISSAIAATGAGVVLEDADDVEALAGAIGQLLDDPASGRRIGENGRNLALADYAWSRAAEGYFALYEAVLGEAGRGRVPGGRRAR